MPTIFVRKTHALPGEADGEGDGHAKVGSQSELEMQALCKSQNQKRQCG